MQTTLFAGHTVLFLLTTVLGSQAPNMLLRQWPEVYDLCHTFLHDDNARCTSQKTHRVTDMREITCENTDSCNVQKRATKSDT